VQVTADIKPSRQCQIAYSKANKVLGMIGRTFSYKSRDVLLQLYKSLVRPNLEYCISAWSPYYEKYKQLLERVQHRFTRMIPGMKQLPCEKRSTHWSVVTRGESKQSRSLSVQCTKDG